MTPTTLARMIWERLRPNGPSWSDRCAVGAPVPEEERCSTTGCRTVRLSEMESGEKGIVSCLEAPSSEVARKLAALGFLPGTDVALLQRSPAYVIRSGFTEIALDGELADHVRVHPLIELG